MGQPIRLRGTAMPTMMLYDPGLFETTPTGPRSRSAMNGFNKGIKTVYARTATPVSNATAVHALRHLTDGFTNLDTGDPAAMDWAVVGLILAQIDRKVSVAHAFGHAFSARYPLQQGLVHAILIPHVIRYVLEETDGYAELLAEGLGVKVSESGEGRLTQAVVDGVAAVRDSFNGLV